MEKNAKTADALAKFTLSRHKDRPNIHDYVSRMFTDVLELHGDRQMGDDPAMYTAIARLEGIPITVIGHVKGHTTAANIAANFGMAHPEGYRKAMRQMKLAEKFGRPIITFVDTPGADPGVSSEEHGQGQAIAQNLRDMMGLRVPIISVIIGEGGSGGALGIACANRVIMLENATYSVISPRGFASILWKDASREEEAAQVLRMTADDLLTLGIIDSVVKEPPGGAHTDHNLMADVLKVNILQNLSDLLEKSREIIYNERYEKFRKMGQFKIIE
ncbi:MAG: acetyl-CoA carboxylase carboxyltransferase subunit alpha [Ruminococcaceae bacterium]|nr:acetyl-CoA carboxylase carboxyltransferase subunit alpha [Oscillospiraceae bacterium]